MTLFNTRLLKLITVSFVLFSLVHPVLKAQEKPNIIFILIDDMGWKDVGFNGNEYYQTPNIDRIATEGIRFTNAYANASNCAPSRACIISGMYTPRHGVYTVKSSSRGKSKDRRVIPTPNTTILNKDVFTMAEALKRAGYVNASMGKWHLGEGNLTGPLGQGFDVNIAGNEAGAPKSYFSPYKNSDISDGPTGEYLTDRLNDEAIKFIEENKDTTFFLYLPHYAVHTPLQAKADLTSKYDNILPNNLSPRSPKFAAMIESTDEGIGKILDKLDELSLSDNTLVIFTSDNGGINSTTDMLPLRGTKGMMYEAGIREPMAIRWPAKITAGRVSDEPIICTDFYPTFVDLLEIELPEDKVLDGVSILPILEETGNIERERLFWHAPHYLEGKSSIYEKWRCTPSSSMRKGDWKIIEYFETGNVELFNLKDDEGEENDFAEYLPDTTASLLQELHDWQTEVNAPRPTTPNPGFEALLSYTEKPKADSVFTISGDNIVVPISGNRLKTGIEKVVLKVFRNGEKYFEESKQTTSTDTNFEFTPSLEVSEHKYKFKVYFIRNVIEEVDLIIDNIRVNSITTSIEKVESNDSFRIYPNPVKDQINFAFDSRSKKKIKIFDTLGKLYYQTDTNETYLWLSAKGFPKGTYLSQVTEEGTTKSKKFIVN